MADINISERARRLAKAIKGQENTQLGRMVASQVLNEIFAPQTDSKFTNIRDLFLERELANAEPNLGRALDIANATDMQSLRSLLGNNTTPGMGEIKRTALEEKRKEEVDRRAASGDYEVADALNRADLDTLERYFGMEEDAGKAVWGTKLSDLLFNTENFRENIGTIGKAAIETGDYNPFSATYTKAEKDRLKLLGL